MGFACTVICLDVVGRLAVVSLDKIESLKMEVLTVRATASSLQRARQQLEAELSSLKSMEESKAAAFEEALEEVEELRKALSVDESRDRKQARHIEELQLKVPGILIFS